jgi:type IV secretion system protein VirB2
MKKNKEKRNYLTSFMIMALFLPINSYAADVTTILNNATNYLKGGLAKTLGLLMIIGCGYACMVMQKLPKKQFMYILIGLGVIFGSGTLYTTFVG